MVPARIISLDELGPQARADAEAALDMGAVNLAYTSIGPIVTMPNGHRVPLHTKEGHTMTETTTRERIAFRSTRGEGIFAKVRWTELAVYYDPAAECGRCWIAQVVGRSTVEDERDRTQELATDSFERTLAFFEEGAPQRSVCEQARVWRDLHPAPFPSPTVSIDNDIDAIRHLYGAAAIGEDGQPVRGMIAKIAADFGIGESSVRMALKAGTGLRVPLVAVAGRLPAVGGARG